MILSDLRHGASVSEQADFTEGDIKVTFHFGKANATTVPAELVYLG